jgi:hypothetical protein
VIGTLEEHSVFSIIQDFSKKPIPYQYATPPGEKCGISWTNKQNAGEQQAG